MVHIRSLKGSFPSLVYTAGSVRLTSVRTVSTAGHSFVVVSFGLLGGEMG